MALFLRAAKRFPPGSEHFAPCVTDLAARGFASVSDLCILKPEQLRQDDCDEPQTCSAFNRLIGPPRAVLPLDRLETASSSILQP